MLEHSAEDVQFPIDRAGRDVLASLIPPFPDVPLGQVLKVNACERVLQNAARVVDFCLRALLEGGYFAEVPMQQVSHYARPVAELSNLLCYGLFPSGSARARPHLRLYSGDPRLCVRPAVEYLGDDRRARETNLCLKLDFTALRAPFDDGAHVRHPHKWDARYLVLCAPFLGAVGKPCHQQRAA
ncbi:hypothetical protein CBM2587_A110034 [Cupriavidus taiwanensis]|uniref:Uncharacterized protein n=1 Tax=Cupriavidus taiwanensis TaxID=164546 RepID=A0A975WTL5_9BURK|nr:hypothetical protein CBM2587_A110034 [Cupriavidus taiwanensis]